MSVLKKLRVDRERLIIKRMIKMYCKKHHITEAELCEECDELQNYAFERLERCVFGKDKPTCARCHIHCYKPEKKEMIRAVMRYSGSRMIVRHPFLSFNHFIDQVRAYRGFFLTQK